MWKARPVFRGNNVSFIDKLIETIAALPLSNELTIILFAFVPMLEIRFAMPIGISLGFTPIKSFLLSYLGSTIASPFVQLAVLPFVQLLKRSKRFNSFAESTELSLQQRADTALASARRIKLKADDYKAFAVFLFVLLPLPMTGVWAGSAIASVMGLSIHRSLLAVALGNLIAGGIIAVLILYFIDYLNIVLFVIVLLIGIGALMAVLKTALRIVSHNQKQHTKKS